MNEAELAGAVLAHCRRLGLFAHHCADSRRCEGVPGLPDLIILGSSGILFAELKGPNGDTSPDQDAWLYWLYKVDMLCGPECERVGKLHAIWRPADWESGTIQVALADLV